MYIIIHPTTSLQDVPSELATPAKEVHGLSEENEEMVKTRSTLRQAVQGLEADAAQECMDIVHSPCCV